MNDTRKQNGADNGVGSTGCSAVCPAAHGFSTGDHIAMNGQIYRVTSVADACSFTLRNARWYDRLFWRLRRAWKWLTSFLPNNQDVERRGQ